MAEISQEEWKQLTSDALWMQKANVPQADIDAYLDERLGGRGTRTPFLNAPLAEQAKTITGQVANVALPVTGGMMGLQAVAGRNALPMLGGAGRALTNYAGEATGIGAGDAIARLLTGRPQDPKETAKVALGGAALGSGFRGMVKLTAGGGNIPDAVIQQAAEPARVRIPFTQKTVPIPLPNLQRVARAGPHTVAEVKAGISPEVALTERAAEASRKLSSTITEARTAKEAIIKQADASGVRLPAQPIFDALIDSQISSDVAISAEAQAYNKAVEETADALLNTAAKQGGRLRPTQVDEMIRRVLRRKVYTSSGQVRDTLLADAYGNAEDAASKVLTDNLPGDIAAKNAEISERLSKLEHARKLFGDSDKAGVTNRLRNAFTAGNEQSAQALNTLTQHDPQLVEDAYDLYVRRQMAGDIRQPPLEGPAVNRSGVLRNISGRVARVGAPFQRLAGGAATGTYDALHAYPVHGTSQTQHRSK